MAILRNNRHEAFARAIVEGSSGRAAYGAAGYRAKGAVADANASRLLTNAKVSARIAELKGAAAQASTIEAARVLTELAKLAFANMADYMRVGPDGDPVLDFSKLTRDQAAALVEVTVEDYLDGRGEDARQVRRVKFKLASKLLALELLGKHLGLFKDRIEHSGKGGGPVEVKQVSDIEATRWIGRLLSKVAGPAKTAEGSRPASPGTPSTFGTPPSRH
jgi:phage terminase small subunit